MGCTLYHGVESNSEEGISKEKSDEEVDGIEVEVEEDDDREEEEEGMGEPVGLSDRWTDVRWMAYSRTSEGSATFSWMTSLRD